jgi:diaminopimelate decarboxylase
MTDQPTAFEFTRRIARRCFRIVDGRLWMGAIPVDDIAAEFGTPLFVYDVAVLQRQWQLLRGALPGDFEIYYSVKANPQQAFLRFFLSQGSGLEVASAGELHQALQAGCSPQRILFAGPGKTEAELETAVAGGIGEIHAESLLEVERISALSRRLGKCTGIALRVNPTDEVQGGAMRMGGKPAPFGIDEECLAAAVEHVENTPGVELQGVHLSAGTQVLDAEILTAQYRKGVEIAARVVRQLKRPLKTIDFGGGLGVPYYPHEGELDLEQLSRGAAAAVALARSHPLLRSTRLIVEPGRFLAAGAGVYLARVNDIKVSRDRKFLIIDGGMHHHLAASGNLGQTIKRNFPVALLTKMEQPGKDVVDVVGPLCTPLDVLARKVSLPEAAVGDLFGVFQSGAYARSASPLGFLSHPAPAEVWVNGDEMRLVRRRGREDDFLREQVDLACAGAAT